MVKEKILWMNEDELVEMSLTYKKINLSGENFTLKGQFHEIQIEHAQSMFKIRTNKLLTVQMNFMGDNNFAANLWTCTGCNTCMDL